MMAIDMGTHETPLQRTKLFLSYLGYSILIIWTVVLVTAFVLRYLFDYPVPEILTSLDFTSSALGYSCLIYNIFYPVKKGDKFWKIRFTISLIIGLLLVIAAVCGIVSMNSNVFTYVCFVVGLAIVVFSVKNATKV